MKNRKFTKRIRFGAVEIGQYFETEWKEKCLKTDEVRIITDRPFNFLNMFNFNKNKLDRCDSSQWVWVEEQEDRDSEKGE